MPAQTPLGKITNMSVYLFERLLPDPFVFAILLTMLTAVLAFLLAPHAAPGEILTAWYNGIFQIFQFAFQMVLILVTGYALSTSRPVAWLLARTARLPNTAGQAVALTMLVSMGANLLNWGFGLVVSALFARQIARRVRVDFAWLMAAAYAGFLMFPPGLSSSIALAEATPGSALNITQKITGQIVPLSQTLLPWFNILPTLLIIVVLPVVFTRSGPAEADVIPADIARLDAEDAEPSLVAHAGGLAGALDRAWLLNAVIVAAILTYVVRALIQGSFHLDINMLILIFLGAGLALHARPIAYAAALQKAARVTGPLLLQYPFYGGIMGIMTTTGLAGVVATLFVRVSTRAHAAVLGLRLLDHHQPVRAQRRRALGGAGPLHRAGRRGTACAAGPGRHVGGLRRVRGQHDPAFLGAAPACHRRHRRPPGAGVQRHQLPGGAGRVWRGHAGVCLSRRSRPADARRLPCG